MQESWTPTFTTQFTRYSLNKADKSHKKDLKHEYANTIRQHKTTRLIAKNK